MSVSPAQNFSKPPPVPEVPTVICTSGFSSLNSSAAACANGATVEEPSMAILPDRSPPPPPPLPEAELSSSPPQAATPSASTSASAGMSVLIFIIPSLSSCRERGSQRRAALLLPTCGRLVKEV